MESKPKLSERIREAAGFSSQARLDALAAEVADLEKREVPKGWTPVWLQHESGAEVWAKDCWHRESAQYPFESDALDDIPLDDWRAAIAAAEAANAKEGTDGS